MFPQQHLQTVQELCKSHGIKRLYLFGSAARNAMHAESDVDFLYEWDEEALKVLEAEKNLDAFLLYHQLLEELERLFQKKIDLVPLKEIHNSYFLAAIEKDKKLLFAA